MKVCAETNYDIGDIVKVNYGGYDEIIYPCKILDVRAKVDNIGTHASYLIHNLELNCSAFDEWVDEKSIEGKLL